MTDLRRLQYFVAVARERNFTRAAERLHVAQPALSRQVKLLERELGVELLHRTTHEFELTEAGEFLLERGPALLAASDELWRSVRTFGTGEHGGVLIAYGGSSSYETAPRLLQALTERHPGIGITTAVKSVGEIVAGLRDGSIGLGLVRCVLRPPSLKRAQFASSAKVCWCIATIGLRRDRPSAWKTLPMTGCCCIRGRRTRGTTTRSWSCVASEVSSRASCCGH